MSMTAGSATTTTSPWNGTNHSLKLHHASSSSRPFEPAASASASSSSYPIRSTEEEDVVESEHQRQQRSQQLQGRSPTPPLLSGFPPLGPIVAPAPSSSPLHQNNEGEMPAVPASSSLNSSSSATKANAHNNISPPTPTGHPWTQNGFPPPQGQGQGRPQPRSVSASASMSSSGTGSSLPISSASSAGNGSGGAGGSTLSASAAVYHPYKRQPSAKNLKEREKERDRERDRRGTRATPSPVPSSTSSTVGVSAFENRGEQVGLGGALPPFPTSQPAAGYRIPSLPSGTPSDRQAQYARSQQQQQQQQTTAQAYPPPDPPAAHRTPSHDSVGTNATARPVASSLPPGAAPPAFPGTSYARAGSSSSGNSISLMSMTTRSPSGRQRANSTGSTSSIGSHGTVGVAMRAGRGGVPLMLGGSGGGVMQGPQVPPRESSFRSTDRVFDEGEEVGQQDTAYIPSDAFEDASSPVRPSHRRQSSSTSSVGQVIRPTIGGRPSSFAASSPSTVTPVTVVAEMGPPPMTSSEARAPPVAISASPTRKAEKLPEKKEEKKSGGGLKGRLQKALKKDSEKEKERSSLATIASAKTPPRPSPTSTTPGSRAYHQGNAITPERAGISTSNSAPAIVHRTPQSHNHQSNDSESSTQSSAQPKTPPEAGPIPYPNLGARRPSNSSFAPSMVTPLDGGQGKPKRSLFNLKNASTDNISISSTVSSASMMIRRMGALGKLARRNSLAGISKIFKDKSKDDDDLEFPKESKKSKKEKKGGLFGAKSNPASSSTSYATADADRSLEEDRTLNGLSPAAQLARQHTLRSKAEERRSSAAHHGDDSGSVSSSMGTANPGQFTAIPSDAFAEDDAESGDDSDLGEEGFSREFEGGVTTLPTVGAEDGRGRENTASTEEPEHGEYGWGQTYRDRYAVPERSILKASLSHNNQGMPRRLARSSSVEFANQEAGPLTKLHGGAFDNIDGTSPVERENDPSLAGGVVYDPFSPAFSPFESQTDREPLTDRLNMPYSNASLNTSAPVLSKMAPGKAVRSTTSPLQLRKNLNWAPECAVYHTFHSSEYDRRSGPATCNSLTPEIAQKIKDELNGYKLEEMDVHPSSRIHTHFL